MAYLKSVVLRENHHGRLEKKINSALFACHYLGGKFVDMKSVGYDPEDSEGDGGWMTVVFVFELGHTGLYGGLSSDFFHIWDSYSSKKESCYKVNGNMMSKNLRLIGHDILERKKIATDDLDLNDRFIVK